MGLEMSDEVQDWLADVVIGKFYIRNGLVYVKGDVTLENNMLNKLPCQFEHVTGEFWAAYSGLYTLKGCPKIVGESFSCSNNHLTSLEGGPRFVGYHYYCSHNRLSVLTGAAVRVGMKFDCRNNNLVSLEGAPKYVGHEVVCCGNSFDVMPDHSFIRATCGVRWR